MTFPKTTVCFRLFTLSTLSRFDEIICGKNFNYAHFSVRISRKPSFIDLMSDWFSLVRAYMESDWLNWFHRPTLPAAAYNIFPITEL